MEESLRVAMELYVKNLEKTNKQVYEVAGQFEQLGYNAQTAERHSKQMFKDLENRSRGFRDSLMKVGFGLLFQGMAIQRFFGTLGKGMLETYMLAEGQNSATTNSINQLSGAWEFLKYSIVDALVQTGILDWVIEKVISLIDWVSGLSEGWRTTIGVAIGLGFVIGTISVLAGQAALSFLALLEVFSMIKGLGMASMFTKIGTTISGLATPVMAFLAAWALPIATILAFLGLLLLARKYTDNWSDAFELAGWSIVRALQIIVSYGLALVAKAIIDSLQPLIMAYNFFTGGNFKLPSFGSIQEKIDSMLGGDYVQQQITAIMARKQAREEVAASQAQLDSERRSSTVTNNITINATQQPGESVEEFARRIAEHIERQKMINSGSTAI